MYLIFLYFSLSSLLEEELCGRDEGVSVGKTLVRGRGEKAWTREELNREAVADKGLPGS